MNGQCKYVSYRTLFQFSHSTCRHSYCIQYSTSEMTSKTCKVIADHFPGRIYENKISKGPIVNPPSEHYKYGEVLLKSMKKNSELIGQIEALTGKEDTFSEMADRCIRCALWLKKQGVKPGDVIGICTQSHFNHLTPIIASLFIGSIANPWWDNLEEDLVKYFVELIEPKVIFASEKNAQFIKNTIDKAGINLKIIVFGNVIGFESFNDILNNQDSEEVEKFQCTTIESANQPAIILFTSGTTGNAKGVLHSYDSIANNLEFLPKELMSKSCGMCFAGIAWISGIMNPFRAIEVGANIIITSDISESDSFKMIEKYKVTWLTMGTGTANRMAKTSFINSLDYSAVKVVSVGGALVKKNVSEFMDNIFPNAWVLQCYGTTEIGGTITQTEVIHSRNSCGKIVKNMEIKVMSQDGDRILGPNEEGEFYIKSPYMFLEYYKNSNAKSESIDSEHWFHSGDLGYCNEDGEFFIIDRIKELIKCRLDHVAPGPIEEIIYKHPSVAEVAVVAKPDNDDVEQAMAFVVKNRGATITEEEIINFVRENKPERFHLNGGVKFMKELPYTASGKVSKKILRQIAKYVSVEFEIKQIK